MMNTAQLILGLAVSSGLVSVETYARPVENERSVLVELRVQKITRSRNDELRIYAEGNQGNENLRIIFRFPKAKTERWSGGKDSYKYPAFVESETEETKRQLDEALSLKFGGAEPRTIFKPRGYIAECQKLPEQFVKTGGYILLIDPGLEAGGGWAIKILYSPNDNSFVLEISQLRA